MLDHLLATPKGLCLVCSRNFRSSPSPLQEIHPDYRAARGRVGAKASFEIFVLLMSLVSKETRTGRSAGSVVKLATEWVAPTPVAFSTYHRLVNSSPVSSLALPTWVGDSSSLICVALQGRCEDLLWCLWQRPGAGEMVAQSGKCWLCKQEDSSSIPEPT